MNTHRNSSREPQVNASAYAQGYDNRFRWSSYWLQIEQALAFASQGKILEIGIGNGVVSSYLRSVAHAELVTADLDPELHPDVVAEITKLPFDDASFACVIACQILEHMPLAQSRAALVELRRVGRHAVISVPNADRRRVEVSLRVRNRSKNILSLRFPDFLWMKPRRSTPNHYWEINLDGYSLAEFKEMLVDSGWTVRTEFRNPNWQYHHFFVLD